MMKITCWTPRLTAAITAASLALSVLVNRLFATTCAVSVASCAALGSGKLWRPAFLRRQRGELCRAGEREALETSLGQLGIILIRRHASGPPHRPVAAIAKVGIRARRRLRIDHVHRVAIAAEAH